MESSGMDCTSKARRLAFACACAILGWSSTPALAAGTGEDPGAPKAPAAPVKPAVATKSPPTRFGIGAPRSVDQLPKGLLKSRLNSLPDAARTRALRQLQDIAFPLEDTELLRADDEGHIFVEETLASALSGPSASASTAHDLRIEPDEVFRLHSRPGSSNVLYLDFDGGPLHPDSEWNPGTKDYYLQPFDPSANDPTSRVPVFTEDELGLIAEIWHRIAEDFAQFDIDVTTEEPAVFTPTTGRVAFTHHQDASGRNLPGSSGGGIAYVNKFGQADYPTRWSPALVYYSHLSSSAPGNPAHTAELGSHEFGHNLGLTHDGASGQTYYYGHGEGMTSWAPIMGAAFDRNVTTWSKGEYPGANNGQDDIAVILGRLGPAGDDHGESPAIATPLWIEDNGDVLVSTPEEDPDNLLADNKGMIDGPGDRDWFTFESNVEAQVHLEAVPAWLAFRRDGARGANLDVVLRLLDESGAILWEDDPLDDTSAIVEATLPAGRYFLEVEGTGTDTTDGYTAYASQGMYFVQGWITPADGGADTQPPEPGVMAFESAPAAIAVDRIRMTATTATDPSGGVQYYFTCVAGDTACADSGWTLERTWELGGLTTDTPYAFTVRARDAHGNETRPSASAGVRTLAPPENRPPVAVARYEAGTAVVTKGNHADVRLVGSDSSDPDGSIAAWSWTDEAGSLLAQTSVPTVRLATGTHRITLTVTDNEGLTGQDTMDVVVAKPGDSGAGDNNGAGRTKKPAGG